MKKLVLFIPILSSLLYSSSLEYQGNVSFEYKNLNYDNTFVKDKNQKSFEANIEIKKYFDDKLVFMKLEALRDIDDKQRKYNKINELYYKQEFDNIDFKIGKDIKYWGSLELHNLSDIYNEKNIINNAFDKDKKLGTSGISISYFMENEDELILIVNEDETQDENIAAYAKYSGSRDDIASRDFSYILSTKDEQFITYHTLILDESIYKLEYLYSNKLKVYEFGAGVEHTLYGIIEQKDLGLLLEYYKSDNRVKRYQDDIFAGLRFSFNDEGSSDILAGIIRNRQVNESSYSIEYNARLSNQYKIKLNYLKSDALQSAAVKIYYYF